jgi:hypothetical protein
MLENRRQHICIADYTSPSKIASKGDVDRAGASVPATLNASYAYCSSQCFIFLSSCCLLDICLSVFYFVYAASLYYWYTSGCFSAHYFNWSVLALSFQWLLGFLCMFFSCLLYASYMFNPALASLSLSFQRFH